MVTSPWIWLCEASPLSAAEIAEDTTRERVARADGAAFDAWLAASPDVPPVAGGELPTAPPLP